MTGGWRRYAASRVTPSSTNDEAVGGIHYTFDNDAGLRAGIYLGQKIRTLRFTAGDSE